MTKKLFIETVGCQMNVLDSELVVGSLRRQGYSLTHEIRDADLILVNYSKASVGTSMEVFYASHDLGKFVIAFSPLSFKDCSPWMARFCTKILPDLDVALTYIERHF